MKKAMFLLKRKSSITHEQFREHYESIHVALAHKHLRHVMDGYRRSYVQNIHGITNGDAGSEKPSFDYDCITEMWFRTDADFDEWMRLAKDPVIGGEFVADEHNFLNREEFVMTICDEVASDRSDLQIV